MSPLARQYVPISVNKIDRRLISAWSDNILVQVSDCRTEQSTSTETSPGVSGDIAIILLMADWHMGLHVDKES